MTAMDTATAGMAGMAGTAAALTVDTAVDITTALAADITTVLAVDTTTAVTTMAGVCWVSSANQLLGLLGYNSKFKTAESNVYIFSIITMALQQQ